MPFPAKIPCPNCRDWHLADKGDCPVPGCDWGFIDYEIDLSYIPDKLMKDVYPAQCECGHIFLESYQFAELNNNGEIGFCWCGFCKTKLMVKPYQTAGGSHE